MWVRAWGRESPKSGSHEATYCLCTSGGGCRAFTHTLGVYRALHHMGVMGKLDAISSVSGGTWASSVYMFGKEFHGKPIDTERMLGDPTTPSELTLAKLREEVAPFAWGLAHENAQGRVQEFVGRVSDKDMWKRAVSKLVLEPFGLGNMDSYMAQSLGH